MLGKCKGTLLQQYIHLNKILQSSNLDVFKIYFVGILLGNSLEASKEIYYPGRDILYIPLGCLMAGAKRHRQL